LTLRSNIAFKAVGKKRSEPRIEGTSVRKKVRYFESIGRISKSAGGDICFGNVMSFSGAPVEFKRGCFWRRRKMFLDGSA
jgi:hypothetical protein